MYHKAPVERLFHVTSSRKVSSMFYALALVAVSWGVFIGRSTKGMATEPRYGTRFGGLVFAGVVGLVVAGIGIAASAIALSTSVVVTSLALGVVTALGGTLTGFFATSLIQYLRSN